MKHRIAIPHGKVARMRLLLFPAVGRGASVIQQGLPKDWRGHFVNYDFLNSPTAISDGGHSFTKNKGANMKKIAILTSLLALTACGGGSGGGGSGTIDGILPGGDTGGTLIWQEPTVSPETANSNKLVTSMNSRISNSAKVISYVEKQLETFEGGPSDQKVSRAAFEWFAPSDGNKLSKEEQALEIAKLSDWLLMDGTTQEDIIAAFNHDKQKLHQAMHVLDKGLNSCFNGGSAAQTAACFKETWVKNNDDAIKDFEDNGQLKTFDLSNVDFKMVDGDTTETFAIVVDENGKISGLKFRGKDRTRIDDTNDFEFVEMLGPDGQKELINALLTYESHGKNIGTDGLKYADFGLLRLNSTQPGFEFEELMPYAGGYEAKRINKSDIDETVVFNGHIIGQVFGEQKVELSDKNAQFVFDKASGSETLSASFDNWYDVNIVKNDNGITFGLSGDAKDGPTLSAPSANLQSGTTPDGNEIIGFDTAYYGDNKKPSEATALFQYSQEQSAGNYTHVHIGFGGRAE